MSRIRVGQWRDDLSGPMQVVSGPIGKQKVHFETPPAKRLPTEITEFLRWFESDQEKHPLLKAGLAHLWFVTLHPFDDGNGRIARAIGDMALARAEQMPQRCYSLSAQIQKERKDYYDQLEHTQKGRLDVTPWLVWFLGCLSRAMQGAEMSLAAALDKSRFWQQWAGEPFNARQIKILNRLLDGIEGKLTSSKWAAINKCSVDTALRDITELIVLGVLRKTDSGGRSTAYELTSRSPV
jgi:Fic family protein